MRVTARLFAVAAFAAALLAPPPARADSPPDGFRPLFNGRDLTGWVRDGAGRDEWRVEDGELTIRGAGWRTMGWLLTERDYTDFVLRFEFQLTKGANSGVALRAVPGEEFQTVALHLEVQIIDDSSLPPGRKDPTGALAYARTGSSTVMPSRPAPLKPLGQWNQMTVTLKGQVLRVGVNGTDVLTARLDQLSDSPQALPGLRRPSGRVGFQRHTGEVRFRNVQIQELAERPVLVLNDAGHTDMVMGVQFTPDGKHVVSAAKDKTVRVWETATGRMVRVLRLPSGEGDQGALYALAVSPDGRTVAAGGVSPGGSDHLVYLIGLSDGTIRRVLSGHKAPVFSLAFTPDGRLLASGSNDGAIRLWDIETGWAAKELTGHRGRVTSLAFSPDGTHLASSSSDQSARLWSVARGATVQTLSEHKQWVWSAVWSPDGRTLATSSDSWICLWDKDGTLQKRHPNLGNSIVFTPDSRELLVIPYRRNEKGYGCYLLNVETGAKRLWFTGHTCRLWTSAISPGGDLAVTAGHFGDEILLWKTTDGILAHRLGGRGRTVWGVGWNPDGRTVAWGNTGWYEYLLRQSNEARPLERAFDLVSLQEAGAPDGSYARATAQRGSLHLRQENLRSLAVMENDQLLARCQQPNSCCYTLLPNDQVAIGTSFGLHLFDGRTGQRIRSFQGHSGNVWAVAPSPDGRYLLSGAEDQTLRIWRPDRDEPLLSLFVAGDDWIAWTPEGYYAASPGGEQLMGWQVNNGPARMATFHPAAQFRKTFYRPDVVKRLLDAGSVEKALGQADAARGQRSERTDVARALPPKVRLLAPAAGTVPAGRPVEVSAAAEASGGHPITALRLLVDGRPYGEARGPSSLSGAGARASWGVDLPPGKYHLAVKAASAVSDAVSDEVEVTVGGAAAPDRLKGPAGSLYVLAVGINAYPGALRLDAAAPDARAIAQAFQQYSRRLFRSVEVRTLLDREATRRNIVDALSWLKGKARPGDVAVVFYAGHGDAKLAGSFHLLPADVDLRDVARTGIPIDELRERLRLPCSTLLVLDACFSGSVDQRPAGGKKKRSLPAAADTAVRELVYDEGLVVFCGAAKEQEATEEKGHGYFTTALVEGLGGKAPPDEDGLVDISALQLYVRRRVLQLSNREQEPTFSIPSTVRAFALARP